MKYRVPILSFLIVLLPIAVLAEDPAGVTPLEAAAPPASVALPFGSMDDLARGIATYFPKGTGKILSVDQNTVSIEMKNSPGLSRGVLLSAYREEGPFYHPITGVVLGRFEEEVALLEIVEIQKERVITRPITPEAPPLPTDLARLTAVKIPIGITAGSLKSDRFLMHEFLLALEETGRFATTLLAPQSTLEEAAAAGNLYVIFLTALLNPRPDGGGEGTQPSVTVRLQNVKTGTDIVEMQVKLRAVEESDFIVESLQHRLFEKYQKGIAR